MPFDGAGNFTRVHDWTADKQAGIKIESERMDTEFNNFAAGMNQVMLRSGAIPWTGDLKMNGNRITGLGNGTAVVPALSFLSDTTTGIYLNSAGNFGISANSVERLRVHGGGATVVGALRLQETDLAGAGVAKFLINGNDAVSNLIFDNAAPGLSYLQYQLPAKLLSYVVDGVVKMTLDAAGLMTLSGGISVPANTLSGAVIQDDTLTSYKWHPNGWFIARNGAGVALNTIDFSPASSRWAIYMNGAQGGANSGWDFAIQAHSDTGAYLSTPLQIRRSDGAMTTLAIYSHGAVSAPSLTTRGAGLNFTDSGGTGTRWVMSVSGAEGAGSDGSNFYLSAYNNAGAYLSSPMIMRRDGYTEFSNTISVGGNLYVAAAVVGGSLNTRQFINFYAAGDSARAQMILSGGEAAGNVGNNLNFNTYSNAGVYVGTAATIRRANAAFVQYTPVWNAGAGEAWSIYEINNIQRWGWNIAPAAHANSHNLSLSAFDAAGAYASTLISYSLVPQLQSTGYAVTIGAGSTLISGRSSGGSYQAPNAILLNGNAPSIAFNDNNLGTKSVIGHQGGGGISYLFFSLGNGTAYPFAFNITTGQGNAVLWYATSDVRLKSNIQALPSGLDALTALNPITYLQAANEEDAANGIGVFSAGIIAQDLFGTVFEGLIGEPANGDAANHTYYSFNYSGLAAYYIAAFKETKARLEAVEAQLADVLARLEAAGI